MIDWIYKAVGLSPKCLEMNWLGFSIVLTIGYLSNHKIILTPRIQPFGVCDCLPTAKEHELRQGVAC